MAAHVTPQQAVELMRSIEQRAIEYKGGDNLGQGIYVGLTKLEIARADDAWRRRALSSLGTLEVQISDVELVDSLFRPVKRGFRVVDNPPAIPHLAHALIEDQRANFAAWSSFARSVSHELFISAETYGGNIQQILAEAYFWLNYLRVRSGCLFVIVGYSTTSWNQIAAECGTVLMEMLESGKRPTPQIGSGPLDPFDMVVSFGEALVVQSLCNDPRFLLAFDTAAAAPFTDNLRLGIAHVWSGLEAIFDVSSELRYRISMNGAVLLQNNLSARLEERKRIERLYQVRSKAVHGNKMSNEQLRAGLKDSWDLLRQVVTKCVELQRVPSMTDLDAVLLGDMDILRPSRKLVPFGPDSTDWGDRPAGRDEK